MRRKTVVICLVLFGVVISCVVLDLSKGTERSILILDAFFPPLEVGEIDLFGEQPSSGTPKFLSDEEFRERFKSEDITTLLQTGTLADLWEKFGEPLEYNCEGLLFPRNKLPAWFSMVYPTGIVFHLEDHAVVQLDLREPGYVIEGGMRIDATLESVYRNVGTPLEIHDMSNSQWWLAEERYVYDKISPGTMYIDDSRKYYRPKDTTLLLFCARDKIARMSIWRPGPPLSQPHYPNPMTRPGSRVETHRDMSGSLGYLWSNGKKCRENLAQLGSMFPKYSNESKGGLYPALSSDPGLFAFDTQALFPKYLGNPAVLDCPSVEKENGAGVTHAPGEQKTPDYWYFGYCFVNESNGMAFLTAYYDHLVGKKPLDRTLPVPRRALSGTNGTIHQLVEGIERFYITDIGNPAGSSHAKSFIPILAERPGHHGTPGGHVLYMDGHVEWLPYPGPFPMTPAFIEGVKAVEERLLAKTAGKVAPGSSAE